MQTIGVYRRLVLLSPLNFNGYPFCYPQGLDIGTIESRLGTGRALVLLISVSRPRRTRHVVKMPVTAPAFSLGIGMAQEPVLFLLSYAPEPSTSSPRPLLCLPVT